MNYSEKQKFISMLCVHTLIPKYSWIINRRKHTNYKACCLLSLYPFLTALDPKIEEVKQFINHNVHISGKKQNLKCLDFIYTSIQICLSVLSTASYISSFKLTNRLHINVLDTFWPFPLPVCNISRPVKLTNNFSLRKKFPLRNEIIFQHFPLISIDLHTDLFCSKQDGTWILNLYLHYPIKIAHLSVLR